MARGVAAIAVAVAVTGWVVGALPSLQYALVTVAILVVAPGGDLFATALHKLAAIALGATVGAVSSAVIFPVRAHRSAERHMCLAVKRCCDLLDASTRMLVQGDSGDIEAINDDIRSHVSRAQSLTSQSQVLRLHRWRRSRPTPNQMLRSVERLWYTLALVDRLSSEELPKLDPARLERPVEAALTACCRYLEEIAEGMAKNRKIAPPNPVSKKISQMRDALGDVCDLREEQGLTSRERERLFAFSFAWEQIDQTICDIAAQMGVDEQRANSSGSSRAQRRP